MVVGCSDSSRGRALEAAARRAAAANAVPTAAIEDFPGNFYPVKSTVTDLLIVESSFAAALAKRRHAGAFRDIEVLPAARYDSLREGIAERRAVQESSFAVLWAGQPETGDVLRTLKPFVRSLVRHKVELLFRAHPRDPGRKSGAYDELLARSGVRWQDVSELPLADCLAARPRLIVTQFSSVAVEAGFYGVPALHVLLPEAGELRLREKKGYSRLPWCDAGAAFCATNEADLEAALARALHDERARHAVLSAFDDYFHAFASAAPAVVECLYNRLINKRS